MLAAVFLTSSCVAAGDDASVSDENDVQVEQAHAELDAFVRTPMGFAHRDCVHELEDGAEVDNDGTVRQGGKMLRKFGRCAHANSVVPATDGWVENSEKAATANSSGFKFFTRLEAEFFAPDAPAAYDGQTVFYFPSLMPSNGAAIIQPVIQYGSSAAGGGKGYYAGSWYIDHLGNTYHSTLMKLNPRDIVMGTINSSNCDNSGICKWTITVAKFDGSDSRTLTVNALETFSRAEMGVLEAYGVTKCSHYGGRGSGVNFSGTLFGPSSSPNGRVNVTGTAASWGRVIRAVTPSCNFDVANFAGMGSVSSIIYND
jgi:hypothetical protein